MTKELKETINRKINKVFVDHFSTDTALLDLNEEFKLMVINSMIKKMGGWDKIYSDIQEGLDSGYSIDQQMEMLSFVLRNK